MPPVPALELPPHLQAPHVQVDVGPRQPEHLAAPQPEPPGAQGRNAGDYREEHDTVADDVRADHPRCRKSVDIAKRVIGQMPPF